MFTSQDPEYGQDEPGESSLGNSKPRLLLPRSKTKAAQRISEEGGIRLTLTSSGSTQPSFLFPFLRTIFFLKEKPSYWETAAKNTVGL